MFKPKNTVNKCKTKVFAIRVSPELADRLKNVPVDNVRSALSRVALLPADDTMRRSLEGLGKLYAKLDDIAAERVIPEVEALALKIVEQVRLLSSPAASPALQAKDWLSDSLHQYEDGIHLRGYEVDALEEAPERERKALATRHAKGIIQGQFQDRTDRIAFNVVNEVEDTGISVPDSLMFTYNRAHSRVESIRVEHRKDLDKAIPHENSLRWEYLVARVKNPFEADQKYLDKMKKLRKPTKSSSGKN